MLQADNSVKNWWNLPISNLKPDLHDINAYNQVWWKSIDIYSNIRENWCVSWQITLSKIDKVCPLAIPNQIPTISMHIPSLVKIHWYLLKYKKILICLWQITLSKIDKVCPLAIPNQIPTISMHIPSLAKIHWYLLVIIQKQKYRQTDVRQTPTWNHNTPPLSCGRV